MAIVLVLLALAGLHPAAAAAAADANDLRRASTRKPRSEYRGREQTEMSRVLNGHLRKSEGNLVKECSSWSHEELQEFMASLLDHRSPELDGIYSNVTDRRRMLLTSPAEYLQHWAETNAAVREAPHLQKPLRDSHCRQAVMWWVHHLSEKARSALRPSLVAVPMLPEEPKVECKSGSDSEHKVCHTVQQANSCDWCHSLQSEHDQNMPGKTPPNALLPQFVGPDDGNPHGWDRNRRCDQDQKDPPCGLCEGVGGIPWSDKNEDIKLASCKILKRPDEVDMATVAPPLYPKVWTHTGYKDVLIGRKTDPFCFGFFPENNSSGTQCYRPEDGVVKYYDIEKEAVRTDYNLKLPGAFGIFGNITSTVTHVGKYMWIVNHLAFGMDQCICTDPGRDKCTTAPNCSSYVWRWDFAETAQYLGRERIGVEWLGEMDLDHFILWSHHMWTDPVSRRLVRLWKPWNGLQIYSPDGWKEAVEDASVFEAPPAVCKKGGAKIRIHCDDDGYFSDGSHEGAEHLQAMQSATIVA